MRAGASPGHGMMAVRDGQPGGEVRSEVSMPWGGGGSLQGGLQRQRHSPGGFKKWRNAA